MNRFIAVACNGKEIYHTICTEYDVRAQLSTNNPMVCFGVSIRKETQLGYRLHLARNDRGFFSKKNNKTKQNKKP